MKKRLLAAVSTVVIFLAFPAQSFAVAGDVIVANCDTSKANLQRVQHFDKLIRVDIARRLEAISSDYMQPFASRVVENQLDGVALSQTVVAFNDAQDEFKQYYEEYERALADAIDVDCHQSPDEYYQKIEITRQKRSSLQHSFVTIKQLLSQYNANLNDFIAKEFN